ncbi:hypothetical protein GHT06_016322 [Daphnia sinensis]|uniref:Uncharacterized protein n=1 Tax=Daphnia sinensis TaxID=1820382 RepID=A0AAD5PRC9_9CRUS|nr:hypothetical protein GHT06_016322 [Daphnia sinensis]
MCKCRWTKNVVKGYSRLRIKVAISLCPPSNNLTDKISRIEEKEEKRPCNRKETIASACRRCPPATDSLRSLHAGLLVPTGRRRLVGANTKKRGKENWQAVRNQREANSKRIGRRGGNCSVRARSFGSTPSTIVYAPIIYPHVYTHKRTRFYRQMAIVLQPTIHRYSGVTHRKAFGLFECCRRPRLNVATTTTTKQLQQQQKSWSGKENKQNKQNKQKTKRMTKKRQWK